VPMDFIILEMEEDMSTLIILRRPFLDAAWYCINVKNDKLCFDVDDEHVEVKASKFSSISGECHRIDVMDSLIQKTISSNDSHDPLEYCLLNDGTTRDENPEVAMCAQFLEASLLVNPTLAKVETLVHDEVPLLDEKRAPEIELKPLPSSLTYEFFGPNFTYSVIVNASLNAS